MGGQRSGRGRSSWGWHQLDRTWARRLVVDSDLGPGDLVLDIGAGHGRITAELVRAGAQVVAVERHAGRVELLRRRFGDRVTVVSADAADLRLPRRRFHVVANPPFGVTTPLLRRLLQPGGRLESARLVLQEGAAQRWASTAAPGAARWQLDFDVVVGDRIPRDAFSPPPSVSCRVLVISRVRDRRNSPGRR